MNQFTTALVDYAGPIDDPPPVQMKSKAEWYWSDPDLYEDDLASNDDDGCGCSLPGPYVDVGVVPTKREVEVVTAALARYEGPPLDTVSALERFLRHLAEEFGSVSLH